MDFFAQKKMEIEVKCFGKLSIYVNGVEQSAQMKSLKARELIAFLLTYKGEAVKKSTVCEALWEDKPMEFSMDCLYKLIKKIENMPIPFKFKNTRGMIQLLLENIDCDLVRFEQLLMDEGDIKKLEDAIKLYRGTLFEEEDYNWICLKEGIYDNRYVETLDCLQEYYEKIKNIRKVAYYQKLINCFL